MKIRSIEFENFRQFKNYNKIECTKNDNLTIIYGKNGNGKTTLHQLFQWVFYNSINFNKTTGDKLYNLEYEEKNKLKAGEEISTWARIDFEHENKEYSLFREAIFKKELTKLKEVKRNVELMNLNENGWFKVSNSEKEVKKVIEQILPSALSDYFFFDGENMIADLRKTGKDSAKNLKAALFSIFELSHLEAAIKHIGNTDSMSSAIGKYYASKKVAAGDFKAQEAKDKMIYAQGRLDSLNDEISLIKTKMEENQNRINTISETIGSVKSNKEYELERKKIQAKIEFELKRIEKEKVAFGEIIYKAYPKILLKKRFAYAQKAIKSKIDETGSNLPIGLEKALIENLLEKNRETCICGNKIGERERENLKKYLMLFPPYSYTALYNRLLELFKKIGSEYQEENVNDCFNNITEALDYIRELEKDITKLDNEKKKNENLQTLIQERINLEEENKNYNKDLTECNKQFGLANAIYKQEKAKYEKLTGEIADNIIIDEKIEILERVKKMFQELLNASAEKYSVELKVQIEQLLKQMLTSQRKVFVSKDFMVRIYDSFGDESKSEGQFAVVSFAYIGAILKLLKEEEGLKNKEFPLVLDGPFSKLDENQKSNVINVIPKFAPQILLFSKDLLSNYLTDDQNNNVWLIYSNEEKNYSEFRKANFEESVEYFELGGDIL